MECLKTHIQVQADEPYTYNINYNRYIPKKRKSNRNRCLAFTRLQLCTHSYYNLQ